MKKIMSLGGNYYQKTAVKAAKRLGHYVISVDYIPDNPAHKYADEYHNISIVEKDMILDLAKRLNIDGIISFASDVGAPTAAYVADKLGLQTNSLDTVDIMTNKGMFHKFLSENGFIVPETVVVTDFCEINLDWRGSSKYIVKPEGASGSKGISLVDDKSKLDKAFERAIMFSRNGNVIIENYIEKKGRGVSGDVFVVDGIVVNWGFATAHRDEMCNPLVPIGDSFPVFFNKEQEKLAKETIQRAVSCLGYKNGPINVEMIFDKSDRPVIMELGPRSGGGLLADIIYLSSGVDIPGYCIKAALGEDLKGITDVPITKNMAAYSFHSAKNGVFKSLQISKELEKKIISNHFFIKPGEKIERCDDSSKIIAIAICEFNSYDEMMYMMDNMTSYYKTIMEN